MKFAKSQILVFVCLLVLIDFITKFLVSKYNIHFGIINYSLNSGIIFGFLKGYNWIFILINLFVVLFLGYYLFFKRNVNDFGFVLVLAGAIGNLIDRFVYSAVIDFIDLKYWYIFNLADAFVVIGVCLILFTMLRDRK